MEILQPDQLYLFENFIKNHPAGSFTQSIYWPKVKLGWNFECVVSRDDQQNIVGAMLIFIKKIPVFNKTMLYSPRGPVCNLNDFKVIKDLIQGARAVAQKYNSYVFKMDPYILADNNTFIENIQKLGIRFVPNLPHEKTIQTRFNYMMDIKDKSEQQVIDSFHSKWRYNIGLSQRKGVVCKVCDISKIDDFYQLMKITGERDGFPIRPKEYFIRMLESLGSDHCRLFICYKDDTPLSGAITTQFAGKTCYVYGASSNELRNLMPNYLMQWTMIKWAIENNNYIYDFQGVINHLHEDQPNYGMYKFKKGFNGQLIEFAGEFDLVFSPSWEKFINLSQTAIKSIKKIFRK